MRSRPLYALWICTTDGVTRRSIVGQRLDTTVTGWIPLPLEFDGYGPILRGTLENVAAGESSHGKAPCIYLGSKLGNRYEPDPDKWKCSGVDSSSRKDTNVFFMWKHVRTGSNAHLTNVLVRNALHQGLPGCPLCAAAPSNLTFPMEFITAVAELKRPGAKYVGICFESERPQILPHLPDGGLDIQDELVYWVLPGGKSVCMSLRDFARAPDDELAPVDSDEAYIAIGREMGYVVLGCAPEADVSDFREEVGILEQHR